MKFIALTIVAVCGFGAIADEHVNSYQRKDGTTVHEYERTNPNQTKADNYSTKGNTNPYTGKQGTKTEDDYK